MCLNKLLWLAERMLGTRFYYGHAIWVSVARRKMILDALSKITILKTIILLFYDQQVWAHEFNSEKQIEILRCGARRN